MTITGKQRLFGVAIIVLSLLSITLCGFTLASAQASESIGNRDVNQMNETIALADEDTTINPAIKNEHEHIWQQTTELVHHDAVTHQIEHPAEYEDISVNYTVCNICGTAIDNNTREHAAHTGHNSYTTQVPLYEEKVVQAAWTETVIDEDAYDELVVTDEICALCNMRKDENERPLS